MSSISVLEFQTVIVRRVTFNLFIRTYVPFNDPQNNGNMVKKALFEPLMIPDANIFYINTAVPPDESAKKYAQRIRSHFKNDPLQFVQNSWLTPLLLHLQFYKYEVPFY